MKNKITQVFKKEIKEAMSEKKKKALNKELSNTKKLKLPELIRLNSIMNNLTIKGIQLETVIFFLDFKEKLEDILNTWQADLKVIAEKHGIKLNKEGEVEQGDKIAADEEFKLYAEKDYEFEAFITRDELLTMAQEGILAGDLSFLKQILVKKN